LNFVIIAAALFAVISLMKKLNDKQVPAAPKLKIDQQLLTEIRDSLKK
jgi:large-conductance mechanosensitive channel